MFRVLKYLILLLFYGAIAAVLYFPTHVPLWASVVVGSYVWQGMVALWLLSAAVFIGHTLVDLLTMPGRMRGATSRAARWAAFLQGTRRLCFLAGVGLILAPIIGYPPHLVLGILLMLAPNGLYLILEGLLLKRAAMENHRNAPSSSPYLVQRFLLAPLGLDGVSSLLFVVGLVLFLTSFLDVWGSERGHVGVLGFLLMVIPRLVTLYLSAYFPQRERRAVEKSASPYFRMFLIYGLWIFGFFAVWSFEELGPAMLVYGAIVMWSTLREAFWRIVYFDPTYEVPSPKIKPRRVPRD